MLAIRELDMLIYRNSKEAIPFTTRMSTDAPFNSDWLTHQHRDTLSSIVGHPTLLSYLAIADGEARGRVKFEMTERMLQPCGPPPQKEDD
ncbi:hypothetical protein VNI00_006941 [Paramarasmius palmivorus]|uniref:Splicing factor subunit n=1 Tax=Paramarasmius palmivorus TaxID=297713 RepID=A0AAW0D326_9AGAR